MGSGAGEKAATLVEALPYIRRFFGRIVVVKYGGNALADAGPDGDDALTVFAEDVVLMHAVGMRPVVVHGGGPQITELMTRLGKVAEFRDGLRVTDAETVDIARMVLRGQVNPAIVVGHQRPRPDRRRRVAARTPGSSGPRARNPDLGFVGDVGDVNPVILERLLARSLIPVVATIGRRRRGPGATTSTPTPSRARWPRRSAPRSSSTSPTSRACGATSTTPPA